MKRIFNLIKKIYLFVFAPPYEFLGVFFVDAATLFVCVELANILAFNRRSVAASAIILYIFSDPIRKYVRKLEKERFSEKK